MREICLLFVGDVMLGRGVNEVLRERPPDYPWGDTLGIFRAADFRMCNLECAISNRGAPWPGKTFTFRSDARNVAVLKAAGIDAVSLANNHALDFGPEALADTLAILDGAAIAHAGAEMNRAAAFEPATTEVAGTKIAIVSFTDDPPDWEATPERAGVAYVPVDFEEERAARLFETIELARNRADVLVVAAHWGPNWGYDPPARHRPFARRLIDLGADVVFGHSGHVARGVEIYRGRPIIYCAGDFIDDYAVDEDERNDESFIFVIDLRGQRPQRVSVYPIVIEECRAQLAWGERASAIRYKMLRLCQKMNTPVLHHAGENWVEIPISRDEA
jgi:poly-gamma-glutamate capsule biosynthesis protein CapA/YwtB (metallophosphatase superfamily)